jgi:hypothetical protein
MKHYYLLLSLWIMTSLTGVTQAQKIAYDYDMAGNRISRKVVDMGNPNYVKKHAEALVSVEDQLGERKITVYPNPTKGALAVEITGGDANDQLRIILFNADGRQLQNKVAQHGSTPINMSGYPAAYYILRVENGNKSTEFKIIKQ